MIDRLLRYEPDRMPEYMLVTLKRLYLRLI